MCLKNVRALVVDSGYTKLTRYPEAKHVQARLKLYGLTTPQEASVSVAERKDCEMKRFNGETWHAAWLELSAGFTAKSDKILTCQKISCMCAY